MKKIAFYLKRPDNSNGSAKDNNEMQTQTTKPPATVKKMPLMR